MKISCKYATSLDILFAKGRNVVANATVLVAILSPGNTFLLKSIALHFGDFQCTVFTMYYAHLKQTKRKKTKGAVTQN